MAADKANNNVTVTNVNKQDMHFNNQGGLPDLAGSKDTEVVTAMWGLSPALVKEISNMNRVYASKHGMFASVPIICRGDACAYKDVCMLDKKQRKTGHRCPMEIAAILSRYEQWCAHFDIDTSEDLIDPKDLVDATLVKDLVNIEVQMMRAENKVALNGDFMAKTLLDIDKKCNPYFGEVVAPEVEFLMTLQDKKIKILNQLNATRKDKATNKKDTASDIAVRIFQQVQEMGRAEQAGDISDIEFDEDGNIIEDATEGDVHDGNGEENT